jgi:hypothetical protein
MFTRLIKEIAFIAALTALLLGLAATAGLRTAPEQAEASGAHVLATPRPDFAHPLW